MNNKRYWCVIFFNCMKLVIVDLFYIDCYLFIIGFNLVSFCNNDVLKLYIFVG